MPCLPFARGRAPFKPRYQVHLPLFSSSIGEFPIGIEYIWYSSTIAKILSLLESRRKNHENILSYFPL